MRAPFEKLSETAGIPINDEAASMMVTRYLTAADLAVGRRTLELACASGPGLRILEKSARSVVGADINAAMLARAQAHYRGSVPLVQLSAEVLPFADASFDFVLLLEASYYVPDFERALDEMTRVLSPQGTVLFVNANPERADFIRSPFSHHYHSVDEIRQVLKARGFEVETFGAFPIEAARQQSQLKGALIGVARRILETFHLVPKTLAGRARLKRLLGQRLRMVPGEIDGRFAPRAALTPVAPGPLPGFKVFYALGRRGAA